MARRIPFCHRVSKFFQPVNTVPLGAEVKHNELLSKSYKLMIDQGIIAPSQHGLFYFLPLANRALDKLTKLVDRHMGHIGAQKISCPILTSSDIWRKTNRLDMAGPELFHLKDRHQKDYILSPTHEESVTELITSLHLLSHKQLPLLLYQTTTKFRDEARPRFGLIRSREFLMKDLYSFDKSLETAQANYELVSDAYRRIFEALRVPFVKVKGCSGMMGGDHSHEFHYPADIGDDTLRLCDDCGHSWNKQTNASEPCLNCGSEKITESKGIEVGHLFLLNTRYSEPLQALYTGPEGKQHPLVMGSYGLGLTRILAASLEILSVSNQLRWPSNLAPFSVVIITPKEGSKESKVTDYLPEDLYWRLHEAPELEGDVIIDDRSHLTIGKRLQDAYRTGYPQVVVVGKAAAAPTPMLELIDTHSGQSSLHSQADLISVLVNSRPNLQDKISVLQ